MADEGGSSVLTTPEGDEPVVPASAIGRFLVLDTLGVGGMGVVLSAYDPMLERKVAIKLLRGDRVFGAVTRGRAQLVAEAQAMARLSHPNVVAVHEIAFTDGAAFLVMDHVTGPTLRRWLAERPRSWREVLAMFRGAGDGLAAAHRAGIVHRDFKPENVLVDRDGRARVVDFGIAATVSQNAGPGSEALAGTLAYMAPEQLRGEPCDTRADQFAYCVALWEALHGSRPFDGATAAGLGAAIEAGQVREPTRRTPDWVRAALLRGLRPEPEARWPSLEALLRALGREPRVTRWRLGGVVAAIALVAGLRWTVWPTAVTADPCTSASARLAGVWDAPRKAAVQAAFAATRTAYAGDTWRSVSGRIDAYVARWVDMAGQACRVTRSEGRQSDAVLDLRMGCLEQRRAVLGALTALWAGGTDADAVEHAIDAVRGLAPLAECADDRALTGRAPLPADPIRAGMVAATRPKLEAVVALILAHRLVEARPAAVAVRAQAGATGWDGLRAEAAFAEGDVLAKLKDPGAESPLLEAARLADVAHDDRLRARALIAAVAHVAGDQQRAERALELAEIAEGAVVRAGNDDELRGRLLTARGAALLTSGKHDAARAAYLEARTHFTKVFGAEGLDTLLTVADLAAAAQIAGDYPTGIKLGKEVLATTIAELGGDHPRIASILNNLALTSASAGDYPAAAAYHRRVLDIWLKVVGPDAARTALTMSNLGPVELELGHLDTARSLLERALAIQERALGPEHGHLAITLNSLANVRRHQGHHAEALQLLERALAIKAKVYGAEHASIAYVFHAMALVFTAKGDHVGALAWYQRALELRRKALGAQHTRTLVSMVHVTAALAELRRCAEARPLLAVASAGLAKALGTQHPSFGLLLATTAACELTSGSAGQAIAHLESAIAINDKVKVSSGSYRWWLARALWAAGRRDEARTAARTAAQELGNDADGAVERAAVHAWLASHRR